MQLLAISLHFLVDKFTLLDPDPHFECGSGSGSRKQYECGSMRIQIHSPDLNISVSEDIFQQSCRAEPFFSPLRLRTFELFRNEIRLSGPSGKTTGKKIFWSLKQCCGSEFGSPWIPNFCLDPDPAKYDRASKNVISL